MYSIQFSPLAKEDLIRLRNYLEEEFDATTASLKIKNLIESIKTFESFPLIGRPLMNVIDVPTDYMYYFAEKNYVFYRLEKQTAKILRILDTRQEYMSVLFGDR